MDKKTKVTLTLVVLAITIGSFATVAYLFQTPFNLYDGIQYPHGMMEIMKVDWDNTTGQIKVNMQNFGQPQAIVGISVNEKLDKQAIIVPSGNIEHNQTCEITLSEKYAIKPPEIKIGFNATHCSMTCKITLMGFKMEALYWNESTHRIQAFLSDTANYFTANHTISFGSVFVNGVVDKGAVITREPYEWASTDRVYKISLSGTYTSKPPEMQLEFTADGTDFHLASPFLADMIFNSFKWDEKTGEERFWVYSGSFAFERAQGVTFEGIYINGVVDKSPQINRPYSETYEIILSTKFSQAPELLDIKVMTDFGAYGKYP